LVQDSRNIIALTLESTLLIYNIFSKMLSAYGLLLITENCAVTHENIETEPIHFDKLHLDAFDIEFSARAQPDEWQRTLETRNQRNFVNAVLKYHAELPHRSSGNTILNKVVAEAARYELLTYTLYLYDIRDPANPRSGLTITNLEKLCIRQNCASPGRVRAYIGLMWSAGYLKRHQSKTDSRVAHFEPTKKLMDIVEGWNHEIFKTIDDIFPADGLARRHSTEPRFGWDMRRNATEEVIAGWRPFELFPEVYHFISHDAGWLFLLHMIGEMMRQSGGTHIVPVQVDLPEFGARFGVSRSHLRRLLESAFEKGLLEQPPQNGTHIVLSRRLVAAYFMSMASELSFYRTHALAVQR
jgi:hypothetical protein